MNSKSFSIRQNRLHTYHDLRENDRLLAEEAACGFVPERVFDIHTHLFRDGDFVEAHRPPYSSQGMVLDAECLKKGLAAWLPGREIRALCFGNPSKGIDCDAVNPWIREEVRREKGWRYLALATPGDSPEAVDRTLSDPLCKGLKVYHFFSGRKESYDCAMEEFAPEWMWELLHQHRGILMMHIVRDRAIADPANQESILRLCRKYPDCRLMLAHVARSFSHRHALKGLQFLREIDNAWIDTSAVCEAQGMIAALECLGPKRVLFGSDYPVSNFRARGFTLGNTFHWLYENPGDPSAEALNRQLTLLGIESLTALREAAEATGLTGGDLEDIFYHNAEHVLGEAPATPQAEWAEVKTHISCGTGLMSKRQEQFDPQSWPTFFSRCHGANVWDGTGRRYVDFAGGVGAVLLGYGDETISRAVRRRLSAGTYCTLVNPEEDQLARLLLRLHPWAGRVRFCRGGGEAMAMAVRVARAATGRSGIAFCGYHGWHDWYLAANIGDDAALDGHLLPGLQPLGVPRELKGTAAPFRYNDPESLRHAIQSLGGKPAAIVMEPMRSHLPADRFVHVAKTLAAESGALFILDEITSGWRFGFPGAHTRLGLHPDLAVYAKAMSNGFPCGALVGSEAIMDAADPSFISSSYWTDGVGTSAALACLNKMEATHASAAIWESGTGFCARLHQVAQAHPACKITIGGMPPSPSITFGLGACESTAAKVLMIRGLVHRGFLGSSQLYLMQSHTQELQNRFLDALDRTLGDIDQEIACGTLPASAGTPAAANTFARLV